MKNMLVRALRTFFQSAVGYIAANLVCVLSDITDADMLKTMLIGLGASALSAGLAAVMNMPKHYSDPNAFDTSYKSDQSGRSGSFLQGDDDNER